MQTGIIKAQPTTCFQKAHALQRTYLLLSLGVFQAGLQDMHLAVCSCQLTLQPFPCLLQLEAHLQYQNMPLPGLQTNHTKRSLQSQLGHTDMPSGYVQGATCECVMVTIKVAQYNEVEAVCWCPLPG